MMSKTALSRCKHREVLPALPEQSEGGRCMQLQMANSKWPMADCLLQTTHYELQTAIY